MSLPCLQFLPLGVCCLSVILQCRQPVPERHRVGCGAAQPAAAAAALAGGFPASTAGGRRSGEDATVRCCRCCCLLCWHLASELAVIAWAVWIFAVACHASAVSTRPTAIAKPNAPVDRAWLPFKLRPTLFLLLSRTCRLALRKLSALAWLPLPSSTIT